MIENLTSKEVTDTVVSGGAFMIIIMYLFKLIAQLLTKISGTTNISQKELDDLLWKSSLKDLIKEQKKETVEIKVSLKELAEKSEQRRESLKEISKTCDDIKNVSDKTHVYAREANNGLEYFKTYFATK